MAEEEMTTSSGEPHPVPGLADMIDMAYAQDFNKATSIFNDVIGDKKTAALDQAKVAVADQIFNDVQPEELDAEDANETDAAQTADADDAVENDEDLEANEQ
jgi:hypothetical protein